MRAILVHVCSSFRNIFNAFLLDLDAHTHVKCLYHSYSPKQICNIQAIHRLNTQGKYRPKQQLLFSEVDSTGSRTRKFTSAVAFSTVRGVFYNRLLELQLSLYADSHSVVKVSMVREVCNVRRRHGALRFQSVYTIVGWVYKNDLYYYLQWACEEMI